MNYKKIGVENFRVFKDYTELEIRPITLLTGPNNSGKSSFTKLLLLLKEGINPLNFKKGDHNLEDFEKSLNWSSNKIALNISLNHSKALGPNYYTDIKYLNNEIKSAIISNKKSILFSLSLEERSEKNPDKTDSRCEITEHYTALSFNYVELINLVYEKDFYISQLSQNKDQSWEFVKLKDSDQSKNISGTANLKNIEKYFEKFSNNPTNPMINELSKIAIFNEIDAIQRDYLLFECYINDDDVTHNFEHEILQIQENSLNNFETPQIFELNNSQENIGELVNYFVFKGMKLTRKALYAYFEDVFPNQKVQIKLSRLGNLLFTELIFDINPFEDDYYRSTLFDKLFKQAVPYHERLKKLQFISANRGHQRRVLNNTSTNEIDEIILEFSKLKDFNKSFLSNALEILGIKGQLVVERYQNYISVVYIKTKDSKIALADLGFGFSQIIPIILKIILISEDINIPSFFVDFNKSADLIIEEPESNLHPDLQSKLADIFILALNHYPYLNLIIETHSEYLIRKLQYLTVKEEIDTQQSIIYYFNSGKYVTSQEPKVKRIEINKDGNLTDTFGPGFYDESTRLQFELLKLNKEQNN